MATPNTPAGAQQRTPQRQGQRRITIHTAADRYDLSHVKGLTRDEDTGLLEYRGQTYEFKRHTVMGKEDTEHMINLEQNGWTPVPAERHPELGGRRAKAGDPIIIGGMMLMERPRELTDESRMMEKDGADTQFKTQLARVQGKSLDEVGKKFTKASRRKVPIAVDADE